MVGLVYLFQTKLLRPMYEAQKIRTIETAADEVEVLLKKNGNLEDLYRISTENDLCIRVITENGDYLASSGMGCPLYRMDSWQILKYAVEADQNGGEKQSILHGEEGSAFPADEKMESVILTRLYGSGQKNIVLVSAGITPVDATIETLKRQLWYIMFLIMTLMIFLTVLMNRLIARPITTITNAAKALSHGAYREPKSVHSYREAEQLNDVLKQASEDILKADRAKRDLIGNVSHDLRTPLTMISGYGEMMRDLPGENKPENLQVIIDEAQHLNELVNDLLDLSRMQNGKLTLSQESFNLAALIKNEMNRYEVYRQRDGYLFTVEGMEEAVVYADPERIRQVFNNLLINAIHYSFDRKEIFVRLLAEDRGIRLEVEDHGEGIAEADLEHIWDRYYKVKGEHRRVMSGSGIGLAIVKEILELHGCPYGVKSEIGKGSLFWLVLPVEKK